MLTEVVQCAGSGSPTMTSVVMRAFCGVRVGVEGDVRVVVRGEDE